MEKREKRRKEGRKEDSNRKIKDEGGEGEGEKRKER